MDGQSGVKGIDGRCNCKRLRAPPQQPGRPRTGKEERGFLQKRAGPGVVGRLKGLRVFEGGRGVAGGGGWGATDRRDPPRHRFAAPPSVIVGSHRAGVAKFCMGMGGRVGFGPTLLGRKPRRIKGHSTGRRADGEIMSGTREVSKIGSPTGRPVSDSGRLHFTKATGR